MKESKAEGWKADVFRGIVWAIMEVLHCRQFKIAFNNIKLFINIGAYYIFWLLKHVCHITLVFFKVSEEIIDS